MSSKYSITQYFEEGFSRGATILDASNLERREFPLFDCIKQEMQRIIASDFELGYTYPGGTIELRKTIAEHETHFENTSITYDNVVVNGGGCSGTFDNLFRILGKNSNSRNNVIIAKPAYPEIYRSMQYNGLTPIYIETKVENKFQPRSQDIEQLIDENTSAVFITNPGNPVCTYISQSELKIIAELCSRNGIYLIVDTVFEESPMTLVRPETFNVCNYTRLVKIKGFSKDRPQLNDLRIGWSITRDEELVKKLIEASEVSDFSNSTLIERMALADMKYRVMVDTSTGELGPDLNLYLTQLKSYQSRIEEGVSTAIALLKNNDQIITVVKPEAGNIIYSRVAPFGCVHSSHELFYHILDNCNVMVSPGNAFNSPEDEIWFRFTMSRSPEELIYYVTKILESLEGKIA